MALIEGQGRICYSTHGLWEKPLLCLLASGEMSEERAGLFHWRCSFLSSSHHEIPGTLYDEVMAALIIKLLILGYIKKQVPTYSILPIKGLKPPMSLVRLLTSQFLMKSHRKNSSWCFHTRKTDGGIYCILGG